MLRRRILGNAIEGIPPNKSEALDVVFYTGKGLAIRKQEDWKDGETPIGIVVVPGTHNRYGDGTCGVMSLVGMSLTTPETGIPVTGSNQTDSVNTYWGHHWENVGNNIFLGRTALATTLNYIPYQTRSGSTATSIYSGSTVWPYDGTTTAPGTGASTTYSNNGSYVIETTGSTACDFNGIRNTAALYVKTRTSVQWTASTVTNGTGTTQTPAAACAGRFKTVGTNSFLDVYSGITSNNLSYGTSTTPKKNTKYWYLPSEGEFSYIPSKRFDINTTLLALNAKYGNVATKLEVNTIYCTSCEFSDSNSWLVYLNNGRLSSNSKGGVSLARAFMRL